MALLHLHGLLLAINHGHRDMYQGLVKPSMIKTPLPHTYMNMSALPRKHSGDLNPFCYDPSNSSLSFAFIF